MVKAPRLRRVLLTVHIICSVGWIGAVSSYLVLGAAAAASANVATVRAAWIGMELTGWFVIVPMAILALLSGVLLSAATPCGLFRHYWVVTSLVLTALSIGVVLLHLPTVSMTAEAARTADDEDVLHLGGDVVHPALGIIALVFITVLNVHKPRGLTPYGARMQAETRSESAGR